MLPSVSFCSIPQEGVTFLLLVHCKDREHNGALPQVERYTTLFKRRFLMTFVSFMSSAAGRVLRVVVGLGLIGWGVSLAVAAGNITTGIILAVVGLLPLVAGLLDFCVFAPLFGAPFSGAKVRVHAK